MIDFQTKPGKIVFFIILVVTIIKLLYDYFLNIGPMFLVTKWMSDTFGYYSLAIAFGITYLPIVLIEMVILILIEKIIIKIFNIKVIIKTKP